MLKGWIGARSSWLPEGGVEDGAMLLVVVQAEDLGEAITILGMTRMEPLGEGEVLEDQGHSSETGRIRIPIILKRKIQKIWLKMVR